jgi:hypothetical protein
MSGQKGQADMIENTYTLSTKDFTFDPFERVGFSGKLYLAKPKEENLPTLIIKHENPCSACNEFMYSRLAKRFHLPVPNVNLMDVAQKDRHLFKTPYVAGIEYLDGLRSFTDEEMNTLSDGHLEYCGHFAMAVMFEQEDSVQLSMMPDNHIAGIDFTETFFLTDVSAAMLSLPENTLTDLLIRKLRAFSNKNFNAWAKAGADVMKEHLRESDAANVYPYYLAPMKELMKMSEVDIETLTDALADVYPIPVVVYFEEYIHILKKKISAYFEAIGENT